MIDYKSRCKLHRLLRKSLAENLALTRMSMRVNRRNRTPFRCDVPPLVGFRAADVGFGTVDVAEGLGGEEEYLIRVDAEFIAYISQISLFR